MTLAEAPIVFEKPVWLFLLLLIVPVFLMSMRSIGGLSRAKAMVTFTLRSLLIILLTMALAVPSWEERGEGVTALVMLDRSLSIPHADKKAALDFLSDAAGNDEFRRSEDRVGVVTAAKDAAIAQMPDEYSRVGISREPANLAATDLEAAINMLLAIAPDDTANRIVIASDGNETQGSVLHAAELARANNIPIDVVIVEYDHENEVIFDRLVTPTRVRQGQSANIKLVMRSQTNTEGTVYLKMNGESVDLNGDEPGDGKRITLEPGAKVLPVSLSLDDPGPQQFEAVLEVDDPGDSPHNNRAVGVTFVASEGRVLVIDDDPAQTASFMRALRESDIDVERTTPDAMIGGLVAMSGYDAIVIANLPRWAFDEEQDRMLHAYVHDLGGGLIMLGGDKSFGAGGWIDSETARVLPIELDPPSIQQMPRGALALIMHSCEMAQGNFWGQKVAQSAIEALSRLDYVGIVEFNFQGGGDSLRGASWAFPLQEVGDKQAAMAATKQMVVGDMPDFSASMELTLNGLQTRAARASQKHVVIISDGDPSPPSAALLDKFVKANITVTTIMVGGHGTGIDRNKMRSVANKTGGRFYNVTNPKNLPQIFIKEAQLVSRSLIQEGDLYQPAIVSRLPGPIEGFSAVPAIEGYVLTAARSGLAQVPIVNPTSEGNDPIYAYWNYGLGKTVAYTSDLTGKWAPQWVAWSDFQRFWEQTVRWVMRPSAPSNMIVNTRQDGDRAVVEMEALDSDASFLNFLATRAVVVAPDGTPKLLNLQQTGPGKYRGEFRTDDPGAYLVNVNYSGGTTDSPSSGNLQAAITVPYSREFRTVKHNAALLRELAEKTGGRTMLLASDSPALIDLFDRTSLEVPKSHKSIWDLLAIIAAILFIFDVAARRLAIDPKWIRGLFGRAVSARGEAGEATVAAWKRAKKHVAQQQPDARRGDKTQTAADARARASVRFEADEDDGSIAVDVGSEVPGDLRKKDVSPKREAAPTQETQEDDDAMSRLLKAKRRARGADESDDSGDKTGDENG